MSASKATMAVMTMLFTLFLIGVEPPASVGATSGTLTITSDTTLTEDHQGNILVRADNVTLDCAGHKVFGPGLPGYSGGIDVATSQNGVTIKRCIVTDFAVNGIYVDGGFGIRLHNNSLLDNGANGVHINLGVDATLSGNTSRSNSGYGFALTRIKGAQVKNNLAQDNVHGFVLLDSTHSLVFGNIARDNGDGFAVHGSHENTLRYNTSLSNDHGFTVQESSSHNVFTNNVANLNTFNGFLIGESVANTLSMNVANVNKASGVAIFESDNNLVSRTVANSNADFGFVVFGGSSNNKVEYSVARGNGNFDAWDEGTGVGNIWNANHFGTTTGLPTSP